MKFMTQFSRLRSCVVWKTGTNILEEICLSILDLTLKNTDCIHCYEAYIMKLLQYYKFHDDDDDDAVCVMTGP